MKRLDLNETFEFIHNILKCGNYDYDRVDDTTSSEYNEEILKAYHYYDVERIHNCTLILLNDKIEYVECKGQTDSYMVLDTNLRKNY